MKLTLLLTIVSLLQINANSYSQSKKISLDMGNVTVKEVLNEIESVSEFKFLFNRKDVDLDRKVSIKVTKESITGILEELFSGTDVGFEVLDKQIILRKVEKRAIPLNISGSIYEDLRIQQFTVTGTVTDGQGVPLSGANIVEKGTTNGVTADFDGNFSLNVANGNAILVISYIGFATKEVVVNGQSNINIILTESAAALDEIVVIGYGKQKKTNLTGSVSSINSDYLESRPTTTVAATIQGLMPGLNVTANPNFGGEPGASMAINIRGAGSLSGGSPYVLVDGVPMDMNNVNPNDIESISVLKDAASSAIYGSRAPYGVILITTKNGRRDGKPRFTYSGNSGFATPTVMPKLANSLDFANALNEASLNSGQSPVFSDIVVQRIKQRMTDPSFPSTFPDPQDPSIWGTYGNANDNIDYYDVYYKNSSLQLNHNLSISGGSNNSSYYVGFGYVYDAGQLNYVHDKYERYNVSMRLSSDVSSWLTFKLDTKFASTFNNFPIAGEGDDRTLINRQLSRAWPTEPIYTPNGDINIRDLTQVPFLINGGSDKRNNWDIWLTPSVEIKLAKDWNLNADFSYNINNYMRNLSRNRITGLGVDGVTETLHYDQTWNGMFETLSNTRYMTSNIFSKYEKSIKNHHFGLLIGSQFEENNYNLLYGEKRDFVTEDVPSISTATGESNVDDNISHWSTMGFFSRVTYNYKEKYLLEFNGRYDGSSRFSKGNRWGFFPSFSVGYNISKEEFWVPLSNGINNLKIRASYGTLGNQNVANYLQIPILPIKTKLGYIINNERPVYTQIPNLASYNLTWETSKTSNVGLDASFLNNRLDFTFDYYNRSTENMFGPGETLPAVFGGNIPLQNNATLETKGFDLSVGWKQSLGNLYYRVGLNLSDNRSIVTKYNNPTKLISNYYEGMVLGEIWGYETVGLFESADDVDNSPSQSDFYARWTAGDVKYKDLNEDGEITWGDRTVNNPGDMKIIGNYSPRYAFGFDLSLDYKGFDFSMLWQGVGKRDVWMGNRNPSVMMGFSNAFYFTSLITDHLDYWSPENTDAFLPKPYMTNENEKNSQVQSRYLQDFSYIRLKNLQLGYTLPVEISNRIKIEKMRFYLSGENILTFSKLWGPFDPESTINGGFIGYPMRRTVSLGLNVTF